MCFYFQPKKNIGKFFQSHSDKSTVWYDTHPVSTGHCTVAVLLSTCRFSRRGFSIISRKKSLASGLSCPISCLFVTDCCYLFDCWPPQVPPQKMPMLPHRSLCFFCWCVFDFNSTFPVYEPCCKLSCIVSRFEVTFKKGFEGFSWKTIGDALKNDTPKTYM